MLTLSKVELYGQFRGDIDGFQRSGIDPSEALITFDEWWQIAKLRQALSIVESGLGSVNFAEETERQLVAVTADEQTRNALRSLKE